MLSLLICVQHYTFNALLHYLMVALCLKTKMIKKKTLFFATLKLYYL